MQSRFENMSYGANLGANIGQRFAVVPCLITVPVSSLVGAISGTILDLKDCCYPTQEVRRASCAPHTTEMAQQAGIYAIAGTQVVSKYTGYLVGGAVGGLYSLFKKKAMKDKKVIQPAESVEDDVKEAAIPVNEQEETKETLHRKK
jgi:hypothetical protein